MKVFLKILLVVVGLAGVFYWLGTKCIQPVRRLRDRCKRPTDGD